MAISRSIAESQEPPRASPDAESGFTVEAIADRARLYAIEPDWRDLWTRCPAATPFDHPAWMLAWWEQFGSDRPCAFAVWDGPVLAGFAPFYVLTESLPSTRSGGERTLLLPIGVALSDRFDALIAPGRDAEIAPLLLERIARAGAACGGAEILPLAAGSPLLTYADTRWDAAPCAVSPVLDLAEGPEPLRASVPRKMWSNIKLARRRGRQEGGISVHAATEADWPEVLSLLEELHGARWSERGESGLLAGFGVRAFHRAAAPALLAAGLLRLYRLDIGYRPAGALHVLRRGGWAYFYLAGFDPAFSRASPGTLIVAHAIEEAAQAGVRHIDFLRGSEPYKYEWGAKDRTLYALRLKSAVSGCLP